MGNIDILDTLERLALPCVRVDELGEILSFWKEKEEKEGKASRTRWKHCLCLQ